MSVSIPMSHETTRSSQSTTQRPGEAAVDVRHAVCACRAEAPVLDAHDAGGQGAWPGRNLHRYAVNRAMRSVDDG